MKNKIYTRQYYLNKIRGFSQLTGLFPVQNYGFAKMRKKRFIFADNGAFFLRGFMLKYLQYARNLSAHWSCNH